jgi:porin
MPYAGTEPYPHGAFSPGEGGESAVEELDEIDRLAKSVPPSDPRGPLAGARAAFDALYADTGLRVGTAFTTLGLQAFGAGDPGGAAWDLDLVTAWTLVGRGTENTGVLVATTEYRDRLGGFTAASVGRRVGTLVNTTNGFNDRKWVARDLYWLQRFFDGRLRVLAGRAESNDFVGLQPMQNANSSFVNRSFSNNPTVPFPGHGATLGVSYRPSERFYVTGGLANAYNDTRRAEFDSLGDGDFFYSAEAGWTPAVDGLGAGRYSVMIWRIDARRANGFDSPSDHGFTLVAAQHLGDRLQVWGRYAYADGGTTNVRRLTQAGLGYAGLFGKAANMTGLAASVAEPRSAASRTETVVEVFQRLQLTRFTQASIGAQAVFDPGNNRDEDHVNLVYARLRVAF